MVANFGLRLRFAREKLGLTQDELAKRLGCTRALINHYETGRSQPRLKKLALLAQILQMPQDFFLTDEVKIISAEDVEKYAEATKSDDFFRYAVVIHDAIEADVSPEELRQCIQLLHNAKKKARKE